jgi:hypothetical protein
MCVNEAENMSAKQLLATEALAAQIAQAAPSPASADWEAHKDWSTRPDSLLPLYRLAIPSPETTAIRRHLAGQHRQQLSGRDLGSE